MFYLVLKFVRLQPVLVMFLTSRQLNSTNLELARSYDLAKLSKKTKVDKKSIFNQAESQLLSVTFSNGSKKNKVSPFKQFG